MDKPFIFLFKLAWASRYRIPLIITIGFMAFDIRMQLEVNIQMRQIRRHAMRDENFPNVNEESDADESWITYDGTDEDDESADDIPSSTNLQTAC